MQMGGPPWPFSIRLAHDDDGRANIGYLRARLGEEDPRAYGVHRVEIA
jgi:hypothetical protein